MPRPKRLALHRPSREHLEYRNGIANSPGFKRSVLNLDLNQRTGMVLMRIDALASQRRWLVDDDGCAAKPITHKTSVGIWATLALFVHILGIIELEHTLAQERGKFQICGTQDTLPNKYIVTYITITYRINPCVNLRNFAHMAISEFAWDCANLRPWKLRKFAPLEIAQIYACKNCAIAQICAFENCGNCGNLRV
ncbi:hypothetical protein BJ912DRAFT_931145 [Pholiota molesta]|nr:hypothetical protein BJ912DRAFT_931145 [Pholiota molesta]